MRSNYGRKVNVDGYKEGSPNKENKTNIIPSQDITMRGVKEPVLATPVHNGVTGGAKIMLPGKEYQFEGADYVIEQKTDLKYQNGGQINNNKMDRFSKYFSPKMQQGGSMPNRFDKYFNGRFQSGGVQFGAGFDPEKYRPKLDGLNQNVNFQNMSGSISNEEKSFNQGLPQQGQMYNPDLDTGFNPQGSATDQGYLGSHGYGQKGFKADESIETPEMGEAPQEAPAEQGEFNQNMQVYQYANPYGGVDTEGAAMAIGEGIENKNYGMALAGAGKVGLSLWRNFQTGKSSARQRNRDKAAYYEKQRKARAVSPENAQVLKHGGRLFR